MSRVQSVVQALNFIERNLRNEVMVDDIAKAIHFSTSHFHALFSKMTGQTPADYIRTRRLACAALDLAFSQKRILDIALEYCFESQEAFTRAFKRVYRVTPGVFRKEPEYVDILTRVGLHRTREEVHRRIGSLGTVNCATTCKEELSMKPESTSDGSPGQSPSRRVLSGIPRVGFYNGGNQCPEDIAFPSCLAATLRYVGEDYPWLTIHQHQTDWRLNLAFAEMTAASGMAFSLLWRDGWHQDNADLMFIADPREVVRHAFEHAGYEYEIIQKQGHPDDEEMMRRRIQSELDRDRPVLAFGVIGPPECCLITGYDEDGQVLIGWNYFQNDPILGAGVEFEPEGYFRKRDWFRDTISAITIGEKTSRPNLRARNREALRWAVQVATTPEVYGRHSGFEAYTAWADHLGDDEGFASLDVDELKQRHQVHDVAVSNVAECRWYAHIFLREIARTEPHLAEDLQAAAAEYDNEHTLMWKAWGVLGGNGHPQAHLKLAEAEARGKLQEIIREARECDRRAVQRLRSALAR